MNMKQVSKALLISSLVSPYMTKPDRVYAAAASVLFNKGITHHTANALNFVYLGIVAYKYNQYGFKATVKQDTMNSLVTLGIFVGLSILAKAKKPKTANVFGLMKGNVITMSDDSLHIVVLAEAIITDLGTDAPLAIQVTTTGWTRMFNLDGSCALPEYPSITKVTH